MSTRIGLFGGTFDPIHKGHTHIARAFADELKLDSVIFLPAGDPYHKDGAQTPAEHRLAMTELAAAACSNCTPGKNGRHWSAKPTSPLPTETAAASHKPRANCTAGWAKHCKTVRCTCSKPRCSTSAPATSEAV